ncbi:opacity protein-like surface antigen [Hymenobacter luteus]|uniref:Opacity protein-like surface antigen n=2 Tax=Hymenobacter TaxID=89966 RepID=A0A7W9SXK4_9BACT|nr:MULTISPECIES: phosphatase PAP2 family protein [Hymenobacter]MBB4599908.1 opacity protein-like surface antigen [Hymenobacter latericoloratus]MBB6057782.1 opacity protein-like surface antigen [Hymenobacter luteus]
MPQLRLFALVLFTLLTSSVRAQRAPSPYRTRFGVDAPVTVGLLGVNALGLSLAKHKDGLTDAEALALDRRDVNRFDRFAAGNSSATAKRISDYPFYASFAAAPLLMVADGDVRRKFGQIGGLYLQTMATTGALFTMATGLVERSRPLAYNAGLDLSDRTSRNSTNSFFAGHTAATASATFFAAKVFHDFHPNSPARPFVWAGAAAVPAAVGYLRLKAGKHFLSDNLLGYAVGAGAGILVPQLHKSSGGRLSMVPIQGLNSNGHAYGGLLLTRQL